MLFIYTMVRWYEAGEGVSASQKRGNPAAMLSSYFNLIMKVFIMKKTIAIITFLFLSSIASHTWALPIYSGSMNYTSPSTSPPGGMVATGGWQNTGTRLSWTVTHRGDYTWDYVYTWSTTKRDLSHIIIEVSSDFTAADMLSWSSSHSTENNAFEGPKWHAQHSPAPIFGIKWDLAVNTRTFTLSLHTTRAPMWGDFFAKDGKNTYAWNSGFGFDKNNPHAVGDGHAGEWVNNTYRAWVLVPNTIIPEPGTVFLLGGGLLILALYARRRLQE
jgi:hypothetical protein